RLPIGDLIAVGPVVGEALPSALTCDAGLAEHAATQAHGILRALSGDSGLPVRRPVHTQEVRSRAAGPDFLNEIYCSAFWRASLAFAAARALSASASFLATSRCAAAFACWASPSRRRSSRPVTAPTASLTLPLTPSTTPETPSAA